MKLLKRLMILMGIIFTILIVGVILDGATDGRYSLGNLMDSMAYIVAGIKIAEWVSAREDKALDNQTKV